MSKKKKKKRGNEPLRHAPQEMIPITKDQMWTIANKGLIWSVDEGSFIFFDHQNLSGSQVYWANLRAISVAENGTDLVLIYQNGVEETLPSTYEAYATLVAGIPDDFGWFGHIIPLEDSHKHQGDSQEAPLSYAPESNITDIEETIDDIGEAQEMLDNIREMQKEFLKEETPEPTTIVEEAISAIDIPVDVVVAPPSTVIANTASTSLSEKATDETLLRRILSEANGTSGDSATNDTDLLTQIMRNASGSSYRTSLGNSTSTRDLERDIICPTSAQVIEASSLGFTWQELGGQLHKIDFGHYSDAYLDSNQSILVLDHRYGKSVRLPAAMKGWNKLLEALPFRFRSINRQEVLTLVNGRIV